MIGNDVVDIEAARRESNIWRKGWQEKLFTGYERAFILASGNPEFAVWLLWSMKEAAYKAWNRHTGIRIFAPRKLECTVDIFTNLSASGKVRFEDYMFDTQSTLSQSFIHTIAAQSLKMFDNIVYLPEDDVAKDSNAMPYFKEDEATRPASKSHHGRYSIAVGLVNI